MVLATAYIALVHLLHIDLFAKTSETALPDPHIDIEQLREWLTSNFAWITLLSIPLHTLGAAICFRNQGYNFIEYFVLNTYKATQKLYVSILFIPLLYHYSGTPTVEILSKILLIIDFVLYFWTNLQFFQSIIKNKNILLDTIDSFNLLDFNNCYYFPLCPYC